MTMRSCPHCGLVHPISARFCPTTGQALGRAATHGVRFWLIGGGLLGLLLLMGYWWRAMNLAPRSVTAMVPGAMTTPTPGTPQSHPTSTTSGSFTANAGSTPTVAPEVLTMLGFRIARLQTDGKLEIEDITGNVLTSIDTGITDARIRELTWSPNGRYLLVLASGVDGNSTHLVDLGTGSVHKWPNALLSEFRYQWSPTSDRISVDTGAESGWQLDIVSILGTDLKPVYSGWTVNNTPSWSPNGRYLAVAGAPAATQPLRLYVIDSQTATLTDVTPPGLDRAGFGNDWLPDGRLIFAAVRQGQATLQVLNPETGATAPLLSDPPSGSIGWPSPSPSATQVAYAVHETDGSWSLYLDRFVGQQRDRLWQVDQAVGVYPGAWSPSEEYLTFTYQTEPSGQENQAFLITLRSGQVQPLPGRPFCFVQSSSPNSGRGCWANNEQMILTKPMDQTRYEVVLAGGDGALIRTLCETAIDNRRCALWTP